MFERSHCKKSLSRSKVGIPLKSLSVDFIMLNYRALLTNQSVTTLLSSYAANSDSKHVTQTAERLLNDCRSEKLENIVRKTKVTLALEQSPNILQILTSAKFTSQIEERLPNGLFNPISPGQRLLQPLP